MFAASACAAPCSPEQENFIDNVTGGDECLALEVHNLKALEKPGAHLLVTVHNDRGPKPVRDFVKSLGLNGSETTAAIGIVRPGSWTSHNNHGPGEVKRTSTGFKPQYGKDSYTQGNIAAVMGAINRLREHYKPQKITALGYSGGAAILGAGLGLFPQYAPETAVLVGYPCNLPKFANYNVMTSPADIVSPHTVVKNIPKNIRMIEVAGTNDTNTDVRMMKECFQAAQEAGLNVSFIETDATHDTVISTSELKAAVTELLQTTK